MNKITCVLLAVCGLATGVSATSRADQVLKEKLHALSRERACHVKLSEPVNSYQRISKIWLTDETSKYNVLRNFADFQKNNARKFLKIEEFANANSSVPESLQALADLIKQLEMDYRSLLATIHEFNAEDEIFLGSLNDLERGLTEVQATLTTDTTGCQPLTAEKIKLAREDVHSWLVRLQKIRAFTAIAVRKRSLTAGTAFVAKRMQLKQAYSQKSGMALDALSKQIDDVFSASRLLDEEARWYADAMILKGAGRGWASTFLAYEKALETLKADFVRGLALQKKINSSAISEEWKQKLLGSLARDLASIEKLIAEIEKAGWQGRLIPQKAITAKIISLGAQYPEACANVALRGAEVQAKATDLESYRTAEAMYERIVNICFLKKK